MSTKSILVIDTPENCYDCILNYDSFCCSVNNVNFFDDIEFDPTKTKLNSCPLKLLPKEECISGYYDEYGNGYSDGWNGLLGQICE